VKCKDTAGNISADSSASFSVASAADTTPPSTPTNLTATTISSSEIDLSWTASTDNVGVAGYQVFRGNTQIATSTQTTYDDTSLSASTTYTYYVTAFDAAENVSASSSPATATTEAASTGSILPADRLATVNWQDAGMTTKGGIPNRTTICETLSALAAFGGQYLVRTENITNLDGTPPKRFVVIAFDSMDKAKAWSSSPSQKEVDALRMKATKSRQFLVEGFSN
jgi:uncharacterized protein (DUF1330 family)